MRNGDGQQAEKSRSVSRSTSKQCPRDARATRIRNTWRCVRADICSHSVIHPPAKVVPRKRYQALTDPSWPMRIAHASILAGADHVQTAMQNAAWC
jgi:hypothetical protein